MTKTPANSPLPDRRPSNKPQGSLPLAAGWPGLIFFIGGGVFRTLGYVLFVLAGFGIAERCGLFLLISLLFWAHMSICAAEVIDKMNDERKCATSANNQGSGAR